MKISAIVLTKNSSNLIDDCLASIGWVDEIIIVDSDSTDSTVKKAEKHGNVKVFQKEGSFSEKRNFGAKKAEGDWLFYIDSDERVTPLLKREIEQTVNDHYFAAYAIPRKNILLGHEMKHGGWWPDYVLRIFKKDALVKWEGELHEQPKLKGEVEHLQKDYLFEQQYQQQK